MPPLPHSSPGFHKGKHLHLSLGNHQMTGKARMAARTVNDSTKAAVDKAAHVVVKVEVEVAATKANVRTSTASVAVVVKASLRRRYKPLTRPFTRGRWVWRWRLAFEYYLCCFTC